MRHRRTLERNWGNDEQGQKKCHPISARIRRRAPDAAPPITGRLSGHPTIVTVLDTGMTRSGRPYIAMEYFEHGALTDRLAREGPLPVAEALRIGVKMAGALALSRGGGHDEPPVTNGTASTPAASGQQGGGNAPPTAALRLSKVRAADVAWSAPRVRARQGASRVMAAGRPRTPGR